MSERIVMVGAGYWSQFQVEGWRDIGTPLAAIANKEMVNAAFETTLDQGLLMERRIFQVLTATEDKAEGMAAFIEKRAPRFTGR